MSDLSAEIIRRQLDALLREAFEGGSGSWTYFIDNRPDAGLLGSLAAIGAAEASRPVGGSTVAAHVHHAAFAMRVTAAAVEGDDRAIDWKRSWAVTTVDDAGWRGLLRAARDDYESLRAAISSHATAGERSFGEAVGAIAHLAYHLGAIKQKLAVLLS
jgi:hypothetical protein